jgi:hypothetical protein
MQTRKLLLLLLVWTTSASAAGVYKWVDEQGRVHYGERPPARAQAQEIEVRQAPPPLPAEDEAARRDNQQRLLRAFEEEREQKKAQKQKSQEEEAKRERQCAVARDRVRRYETVARVYDLDNQGNRRILSDEERAATEAQARQEVARWCD